MSDKVLVRHATMSDVDVVRQFINELEDVVFDADEFRRAFEQNINNPNYVYLVARDGDKVVGYISCHGQQVLHHLGFVAEIQELFVLLSQRGKGIGALLLKELEHKLLALNCVSLEVTAQLKREATHEFYKNNGFIFSHFKFTKQIANS